MSKVIDVTDKTFEAEVIKSEIPTEVDFWAPWCGPCRRVMPVYDKLSEEFDGKFKFCKINVDENPEMAEKFRVMSIPSQKFFVKGQQVDEIMGAYPEEHIRGKVQEILKKPPVA